MTFRIHNYSITKSVDNSTENKKNRKTFRTSIGNSKKRINKYNFYYFFDYINSKWFY